MKKTLVSIITTILLVVAIPAVLVLAAPGALPFLGEQPSGAPTEGVTNAPSGEPTEGIDEDQEPTEGVDEEAPEATPEVTNAATERVSAAAALGIPPGRLLLIDRLAGLLGWSREQTLLVYGTSSVQDIMKKTNELRHSGKGHHPVVTPDPQPTATPTPEPSPEVSPEAS